MLNFIIPNKIIYMYLLTPVLLIILNCCSILRALCHITATSEATRIQKQQGKSSRNHMRHSSKRAASGSRTHGNPALWWLHLLPVSPLLQPVLSPVAPTMKVRHHYKADLHSMHSPLLLSLDFASPSMAS